MNYLFFDIECCDGNHICSFGYVICDEHFNILKKEDIIINPQKRFKLGRAGFDPEIRLAYTVETFQKQNPFPYFYSKIKQILKTPNQIVLGHSVSADLKYLEIACNRYGLKQIFLNAYDTQKLYYQFDNRYQCRGLDNIINDLNMDISDLHEHKSCDDAEISLRYIKEICKRLSCNIEQLINSSKKSLVIRNQEYFDKKSKKSNKSSNIKN